VTRRYVHQPANAPTRQCSRCDRILPSSEFALTRGGLYRSSFCHGCKVAATKAWRADNRDALNVARRVHHEPRACRGCGLEFTPRKASRVYCCSVCGQATRTYGPRGAQCRPCASALARSQAPMG